MNRYLVDTTSMIDFSKEVEPQVSRMLVLLDDPDSDIGTCGVVVSEFFAGVLPADRPRWRRLFASLSYWELPFDDAIHASVDRFDVARRGQTFATPDTMIAAAARAHGAIIITENAKDYPMADIPLMSLR